MTVLPIIILIALMFILMILGVPLVYSMLSSSLLIIALFTDIPLWLVIQRIYAGIDSFVLTAIPFFLLMGNIMNSGNIAGELFDLASKIVGHLPGGLAHVNVLASLFFGGISGSAVADTSGLGTIEIPTMLKRGYTKSFTVVVTVMSSVLGQIIPPSLIMIIYCSTIGTSVQAMFISGIVPGIIFALTMMFVSYMYAIKYNFPREEKSTLKQFFLSFMKSIPVLIMPLIVIGGVLTGVFTATESAVIASVYSIILCLPIRKTIKLSDLKRIFINTSKGTANSLICIGAASLFGYLMSYFQAYKIVNNLIMAMNLSGFSYVLFVIILFLILGTFMDAAPAIIIFAPIVVPVGLSLGLHPVYLGIIICLTLAIGLVTPPYGLCLLIGCQIANINPREVFKDLGIMLIAIIAILIIIAGFPDIILWLPRLLVPKFM